MRQRGRCLDACLTSPLMQPALFAERNLTSCSLAVQPRVDAWVRRCVHACGNLECQLPTLAEGRTALCSAQLASLSKAILQKPPPQILKPKRTGSISRYPHNQKS